MIASFRDKDSEAVFDGEPVRKWLAFQRIAQRKLEMLHAAVSLESLREIHGNSLDKPSKDRRGQSSIRINDQFRVCFRWKDGKAYEVEIVDCH